MEDETTLPLSSEIRRISFQSPLFSNISSTGCGILLILIGFIKSLKFGEPYLTTFLKEKGFTSDEVDNKIYPVWTYSYMGFLILISLLSQHLGYMALIFLDLISQIVTYAILIWSDSLILMQIMQVTYGFSTACTIGFFASVAAIFKRNSRSYWTGVLRACILLGHLVADLSAQGFIALGMEMKWLFIMTIIALGVSLCISPLLSLHTKQRFDLDDSQQKFEVSESSEPADIRNKNYIQKLLEMIKKCYTRKELLLWTLLSSSLYCCVLLTESYGSSLWDKISENSDQLKQSDKIKNLNGIMDASGRAAGALCSYLAGFIKYKNSNHNNMTIFYAFIYISIGVFSVSNYGMVADMNSVVLSGISWCLGFGFGFGVCSMINGIITLETSENDLIFMFAIQSFIATLLQTIYQIIASELNADIFWRYTSVAIFGGSCILILPFIYCLRSKKENFSESDNQLISE